MVFIYENKYNASTLVLYDVSCMPYVSIKGVEYAFTVIYLLLLQKHVRTGWYINARNHRVFLFVLKISRYMALYYSL
jgi:hypothetical protein